MKGRQVKTGHRGKQRTYRQKRPPSKKQEKGEEEIESILTWKKRGQHSLLKREEHRKKEHRGSA